MFVPTAAATRGGLLLRVVTLLRHVDGLDELAVLGPQPVFAGPVARLLHGIDAQRREPRLVREPLTKGARQVRHLLDRRRPALVQPAKELAGAIGLRAHATDQQRELVQRERAEIRTRAGPG